MRTDHGGQRSKARDELGSGYRNQAGDGLA